MGIKQKTEHYLFTAAMIAAPIISACGTSGLKSENKAVQQLADAVQVLGESVSEANKLREDSKQNGAPVSRKPGASGKGIV